MRKLLFTFAIIVFLCCSACKNAATNSEITTVRTVKKDTTLKESKYKCPMDCEHGKTHAKPGKCAVCKMDREELK